jgi:hypothetical protein
LHGCFWFHRRRLDINRRWRRDDYFSRRRRRRIHGHRSLDVSRASSD